MGVDGLRRVASHGHDEVTRRQRRLGQGMVGEVTQRVGPEQHEGTRLRRRRSPSTPRRPSKRGCRPYGARCRPDRAPGRGEALAAGVEARPARATGRAPARGRPRRTRCRGAGGQEGRLGQRLGQHAEAGRRHLARLGVRGSAGHDDDAVALGVLRPAGRGRPRVRRGPVRCPRGASPAPAAAASSPARARAISGASPGLMGQGGGGQRGERGGRRERSRSARGRPRRPAQAQEEDGGVRAGRRRD